MNQTGFCPQNTFFTLHRAIELETGCRLLLGLSDPPASCWEVMDCPLPLPVTLTSCSLSEDPQVSQARSYNCSWNPSIPWILLLAPSPKTEFSLLGFLFLSFIWDLFWSHVNACELFERKGCAGGRYRKRDQCALNAHCVADSFYTYSI